jgi:hypothetical protein
MTATAMVMRVSALDTIISAEFDEMPGMRLTMPQVCRLWSLTAREADDVIRSLIARGVLTLDRRGRVCRPEDQPA